MMPRRPAASITIAAALAGATVHADTGLSTRLYVPEAAINARAIALARIHHLDAPAIDRRQSFHIVSGGKRLGILVTGKGVSRRSDGIQNATCFAAFFPSSGPDQLILTVGHGEWEAVACIKVVALGLIKPRGGPDFRIAIIHRARSPNALVLEPVILSWETQDRKLRIDLAAYHRASRAGAQSVTEVRQALR